MPQHPSDHVTVAFEQDERRLFAACGVEVRSRRVRLANPPLAVRVLRRATDRHSSSYTEVA
jgi:hypothetical protein